MDRYMQNFSTFSGASLVAQTVKRLPTMREIRVRSLGQEDPLEKEMSTHSSTLAWKIPWTEEPGRLQSMSGFLRRELPAEQKPYLIFLSTSCSALVGTSCILHD